MKKIPKSITVTVRTGFCPGLTANGKPWEMILADGPRGKVHLGMGQELKNIRKQRPHTPEPPYRVTYCVAKKGAKVVESGIHPVVKHLYVCFLPKDWVGLRVSRKVEKI